MSGDDVVVKINELGVTGIDENRIAIRSDGFRELVVFSNTGEATFQAPRENANYHIVLFNMIPGLNYNWMDTPRNSTLYNNTRYFVVYREDRDGQPGEWDFDFDQEKPWRVAFNQHNQALDRGWIKWGSFTRKPAPNDGQGDFAYGYSDCNGHMGWHAGSWIGVNAKILSAYKAFLRIGNAEIFENATGTNNIDGDPGSWDVMTDRDGNLNEKGAHWLAYVFAKDSAPMN